jgi:tetratricopeptide (TPR) repeat protein
VNPAKAPVLTLVLLTRAYTFAGDVSGAEHLLHLAVTARPQEVVLLDALAEVLEQQGASRASEAIEYYRAVRALRPRLGVALAGALIKAGRAPESEDVIRDLLSQHPKNPEIFFHLGKALFAQQRVDETVAAYTKAIELQPKYVWAFLNRGVAWGVKKEYDKAIADYTEAILIDPKFATAFNSRGGAWRAKKEYDKAIADYKEAILLDRKDATAFNSRAWLRATCPAGKYRDGKLAVQDALRACERTDWEVSDNIATLAAAYAEAGDFEEAMKWQRKALVDSELDKESVQRAGERLKLYQAHKPFREE